MAGREPLTWRKSTFSGSNDCVEWALDPDGPDVLVRDSKVSDGPRLRFTLREWRAFVVGVQHGEADL